MAEFPILPLKTDALIADTSHMTAEQFGAYVRLLIVAWRHGGRLDNDERELARIVGVSIRDWRRLAPVVMRPMTVIENTVTQKRLTDTWLQVQSIRRQRSEAAAKRWRQRRN